MNILKEMIYGAVIGCAAFVIYISSLGIILAHLPITYQGFTADLTKENAIIIIKLFHIFESYLASLPMAIIMYVFSRLLKLKATSLVIISTICSFLSYYLYTAGWAITIVTDIYFIMSITLACLMLWFSLVIPSKLLLKKI